MARDYRRDKEPPAIHARRLKTGRESIQEKRVSGEFKIYRNAWRKKPEVRERENRWKREHRKKEETRLQRQQYRRKNLVRDRNNTRRWRNTHPELVRRQQQRGHRRKWEKFGTRPIGPFDPVEIRNKRLEQVLGEARELDKVSTSDEERSSSLNIAQEVLDEK
jgi:hypothetical protein